MLRRSSRPRHLLMEPLEIRCNLSVIDPMAGAMAEPVVVPCDVVETGVYAPNHDSADRASTNVDLGLTVTDTANAPSAHNGSINISSFAGQTVRIHFESADAGAAFQAPGGVGNDVLIGRTGTDNERSDDNNPGTHVAGTIGTTLVGHGRTPRTERPTRQRSALHGILLVPTLRVGTHTTGYQLCGSALRHFGPRYFNPPNSTPRSNPRSGSSAWTCQNTCRRTACPTLRRTASSAAHPCA